MTQPDCHTQHYPHLSDSNMNTDIQSCPSIMAVFPDFNQVKNMVAVAGKTTHGFPKQKLESEATIQPACLPAFLYWPRCCSCRDGEKSGLITYGNLVPEWHPSHCLSLDVWYWEGRAFCSQTSGWAYTSSKTKLCNNQNVTDRDSVSWQSLEKMVSLQYTPLTVHWSTEPSNLCHHETNSPWGIITNTELVSRHNERIGIPPHKPIPRLPTLPWHYSHPLYCVCSFVQQQPSFHPTFQKLPHRFSTILDMG